MGLNFYDNPKCWMSRPAEQKLLCRYISLVMRFQTTAASESSAAAAAAHLLGGKWSMWLLAALSPGPTLKQVRRSEIPENCIYCVLRVDGTILTTVTLAFASRCLCSLRPWKCALIIFPGGASTHHSTSTGTHQLNVSNGLTYLQPWLPVIHDRKSWITWLPVYCWLRNMIIMYPSFLAVLWLDTTSHHLQSLDR